MLVQAGREKPANWLFLLYTHHLQHMKAQRWMEEVHKCSVNTMASLLCTNCLHVQMNKHVLYSRQTVILSSLQFLYPTSFTELLCDKICSALNSNHCALRISLDYMKVFDTVNQQWSSGHHIFWLVWIFRTMGPD